MLKTLSLTATAIVACLLADGTARGQTIRQEGRIEARASRQAGRVNARALGDFDNRGYYEGPTTYGGTAYAPADDYAGTGYYGPGGYSNGYYGGSFYRGALPSSLAAPRSRGYYPARPSYVPKPAAGRAYLGITMSETADGMVRVSGVRPTSPADEAGIRPGDVIIALDGRDIYAAQDVTRMVARHVPGEAIRLDIDRNGQNDQLEVVLAAPAGQLVRPRMTYPSEYPVDRSEYPAYVEPYEILPHPVQVRRPANVYINAY